MKTLEVAKLNQMCCISCQHRRNILFIFLQHDKFKDGILTSMLLKTEIQVRF